MCGIAGLFHLTSDHKIDHGVISTMNDRQFHRGPDAGDYFFDPGVALAHRRLSIIDLEGSPQPMMSACERANIVFNGEIYNFKELHEELTAKVTSLLVLEIVNRMPVSLDIIRDRMELAKENINGEIENVYTLKILNKSQTKNRYRLSVQGINNTQWHGEQMVTVEAASVYTLPMSISVDPYELKGYMSDITFVIELISDDDEVTLTHESRFFNKR